MDRQKELGTRDILINLSYASADSPLSLPMSTLVDIIRNRAQHQSDLPFKIYFWHLDTTVDSRKPAL